ncbi:MAG: ABC transporter ATP-binding protein [Chloroflexi bacterium]|nr:ABC transporter ATP-binding protein [Chloroflexota bacterium]
MAALTVDSLSRTFEPNMHAVRDVSFTVPDGRIAALLGPSGCGKSTLLRLIAGLERADRGAVYLDNREVTRLEPQRRGVGLMFQELALFPHLRVFDNVAFGLRMLHWPKVRRARRVAEMLDLVGLTRLANRRIDELSGGERQRVALARTLAPAPAVLLLDEPLGAIDEPRKRLLRDDLRALLREVRTTALLVSHDLRDAVAIADDVIVMDAGSVLQTGELARVLGFPATVAVAELVGYATLVLGEVQGGTVAERDVGAVAVPLGMPLDGRARVMAHPTTLLAVPARRGLGCGVVGSVLARRPDGPQHVLDVALGARRVEARWEWDLDPPPLGERVELAVRPGTLRYFTPGGAILEGGTAAHAAQ